MADRLKAGDLTATRIAEGTYRVVIGGRAEIVYVAGPAHDQWAFCDGVIFRSADATSAPARGADESRAGLMQSLTAPMPATVIRVAATAGGRVRKGDTLVVLEAMKMELPIRALADATVTAIRCREGELVQADQVLIDLG